MCQQHRDLRATSSPPVPTALPGTEEADDGPPRGGCNGRWGLTPIPGCTLWTPQHRASPGSASWGCLQPTAETGSQPTHRFRGPVASSFCGHSPRESTGQRSLAGGRRLATPWPAPPLASACPCSAERPRPAALGCAPLRAGVCDPLKRGEAQRPPQLHHCSSEHTVGAGPIAALRPRPLPRPLLGRLLPGLVPPARAPL